MRKVTITIDEDGNAKILTEGFRGKVCTATVDKILAEAGRMGLATKTDKVAPTSDYYAQESVQTRASA